jgi:hypothetical protein
MHIREKLRQCEAFLALTVVPFQLSSDEVSEGNLPTE